MRRLYPEIGVPLEVLVNSIILDMFPMRSVLITSNDEYALKDMYEALRTGNRFGWERTATNPYLLESKSGVIRFLKPSLHSVCGTKADAIYIIGELTEKEKITVYPIAYQHEGIPVYHIDPSHDDDD